MEEKKLISLYPEIFSKIENYVLVLKSTSNEKGKRKYDLYNTKERVFEYLEIESEKVHLLLLSKGIKSYENQSDVPVVDVDPIVLVINPKNGDPLLMKKSEAEEYFKKK